MWRGSHVLGPLLSKGSILAEELVPSIDALGFRGLVFRV